MNRKSWFLVFVLGVITYLAQACDRSPIDPQLSEVLQENGSVNALYAKFLSEANEKTPFNDNFRIYDTVARKKHELNQRLQNIHPTSRYWSLYESLVVASNLMKRLMALEEKSLQQTLDSLKVMQEMNAILERSLESDPGLSAEEIQQKRAEAIQRVQDLNQDWRDQLTQTSVALDNAKNVSSEAVNLLNKEIERLGLPHKQENPFIKNAAQSPTGK